jgi:hypothetical protein
MRSELRDELLKLRALDFYQTSSKKHKKEYLYPRRGRSTMPEVILKKLRMLHLSIQHSLYSNHLHSEYISIRQFNEIKKGIAKRDQYGIVAHTFVEMTCSILQELIEMYSNFSETLRNLNTIELKSIEIILDLAHKHSDTRANSAKGQAL